VFEITCILFYGLGSKCCIHLKNQTELSVFAKNSNIPPLEGKTRSLEFIEIQIKHK